jgi:hypothetical protein
MLPTSEVVQPTGAPQSLEAVVYAPRTGPAWVALLDRLRLEKIAAWEIFDLQRGFYLQEILKTAAPKEIEDAKASIAPLRKSIAVTKKNLAAWFWWPFTIMPLLPWHIGPQRGEHVRCIRLWTTKQKSEYFRLLLQSQQGELARSLATSRRPVRKMTDGVFQPDCEYMEAEREFKLANEKLVLATIGFEKFKKAGAEVETVEMEVARRVAAYNRGEIGSTCAAGALSVAVGDKTGNRGTTGQGQAHTPPVPGSDLL